MSESALAIWEMIITFCLYYFSDSAEEKITTVFIKKIVLEGAKESRKSSNKHDMLSIFHGFRLNYLKLLLILWLKLAKTDHSIEILAVLDHLYGHLRFPIYMDSEQFVSSIIDFVTNLRLVGCHQAGTLKISHGIWLNFCGLSPWTTPICLKSTCHSWRNHEYHSVSEM